MNVRRLATVVALVLGTAVVAGCGPTMGDLPLPGSGVSGDTVIIKVRFDEALNLAQGAAVKVNGVNSGKVQSVTTQDFKAVAVMKVKKSAQMRSTATARLRYTTPLGELFVDVTNPSSGPLLRSGSQLGLDRSSTAPTVEDALSSASLLINGGGLAQLQVVTTELNKALHGREDTVREVLDRTNTFVTGANATTADFLAALDSLARLSRILDANKATIDAALRDVRPAAAVLRQNTPGFTRLMAQVDRFAGTANHVVGATRSDLLTMLHQVSPVLDEFLANRAVLGRSLRALIGVGRMLDDIVPGDYANLLLKLYLDQTNVPLPLGTPSSPGGGQQPTGPNLPSLPKLPSLTGLLGATSQPTPQSGGLLGGLLGGGL